MHSEIIDKYTTFLHDAANKFSPLLSAYDIDYVCRKLGITIVRTESKGHKNAFLLKDQNHFKITIPIHNSQNQDDFSPFQRFLIAHELGHFLLEKKFATVARYAGEYWKLETLCDKFARELLLSEEYMKKKLKNVQRSPLSLLGVITSILSEKEVTWATAAFRVVDFYPNVVFFQMNKILKKEKLIFKVVVSTNTKNKKAGKAEFGEFSAKLKKAKNEFWVFLNNLGANSSIDARLLKDYAVISKFKFDKNVCAGYVIKTPNNSFHLAFTFETYN